MWFCESIVWNSIGDVRLCRPKIKIDTNADPANVDVHATAGAATFFRAPVRGSVIREPTTSR